MALTNVAGRGAIKSVELRSSPSGVRSYPMFDMWLRSWAVTAWKSCVSGAGFFASLQLTRWNLC